MNEHTVSGGRVLAGSFRTRRGPQSAEDGPGQRTLEAGHRALRRCGAQFDLRPQPGTICCELGDGHTSKWHRSDSAGFEWCDRVLWLLPPSAKQRTHAA